MKTRIAFSLLLAVAALAPPAFAPAAAQAAFSGNNGKVAFDRTGASGQREIVVQSPDGSQRVVANGSGPRWSPDGTRIVYNATATVQCKGRSTPAVVIRVINADGTGQRNVTNGTTPTCGASATMPAWSPDGTRIVYVGAGDCCGDIFTISVNGGASTRLTNNGGVDKEPVWSSLNKIAWVSDVGGSFHSDRVWTMNANGTAQRRLSTGEFSTNGFLYDERHPDWSPDGLHIAFSSDRDKDFDANLLSATQDEQNTEIYTMNADGTAITRLTFNRPWDFVTDFWDGIGDVRPAFSPDGRKILFESNRFEDQRNEAFCCGPNTPFRVWKMNADGSSPTEFAGGEDPDWQPVTAATADPAPLLTNLLVPNGGSFAGDEPITGRVYLSEPAPAGGTAISLTGDDPAFSVPPSVTVPAGATSALVTIGAPAHASVFGSVAHITASQAARSFAATVVSYPLPTSAAVSTTHQYSSPIVGHVALDSVAPSTGADVTLTSSDPALATLPATVHIAPRARSIDFAVPEAPVGVRTPVTLTATYNGVSKTFAETVLPPAIQLDPSSVAGGQSTTGTVNLIEPAGPGGLAVHLDTDDATVVHVPPSVTVPEGGTLARFTITTSAVTNTTKLFVNASFPTPFSGAASARAQLTVTGGAPPLPPPPLPVTMSSLTFAPAPVTGGASTTATFTLTGPAPTGGFTVNLESTSPSLLQVPATITVPAGQTSTTFTATTRAVTAPSAVDVRAFQTIFAILIGHLTVNPPPNPPPAPTGLTLSPAAPVGGAASQGALTIASAAPAGGAAYDLASSNLDAATVPPTVLVPAGATSVTFPVTTKTVTVQQIVTLSASLPSGALQQATLTVNPQGGPPQPPPPGVDTVAVTRAEYDGQKRTLRVEATSSSTTATLRALVDGTGAPIGTLTNAGGGKYTGQFTNLDNPLVVRVTSSLGGSAALTVAAKSATVHPAPTTPASPAAGGSATTGARTGVASETKAGGSPSALRGDPGASARVRWVRVAPGRFRVSSLLPQLARRVTGSRIVFSLSHAARVRLRFTRAARRGTLTGQFTIRAAAGTNRLRFGGMLHRGVALAPGGYRVTLTAIDAAGRRSAPVATNFTLLKAG